MIPSGTFEFKENFAYWLNFYKENIQDICNDILMSEYELLFSKYCNAT